MAIFLSVLEWLTLGFQFITGVFLGEMGSSNMIQHVLSTSFGRDM